MGWLRAYVTLVQLNVTTELSNVSKKKKQRTIECDKSTITYDIGIAQCNNGPQQLKHLQFNMLNVTNPI